MSDQEILKNVLVFLKANNVMTLATAEENDPWVCTVYYGVDDDLNLYVVTSPKTIHGGHITKSNKVAAAIFDSHVKLIDDKEGLCLRGTCTVISNPLEIVKGLTLWHKNNPGAETKIKAEDIIKLVVERRVYKIIPTFLKHYSEAIYGEDQEYGIWGK